MESNSGVTYYPNFPDHCLVDKVENGNLTDPGTYAPFYGHKCNARLACDGTDCSVEGYSRDSWADGIGTPIDPSCIQVGQTWKITAKVRLYNEDGNGGITGVALCSPQPDRAHLQCPTVRIRVVKNGWESYPHGHVYAPAMVWDATGGWVDFEATFSTNSYMAGVDEFGIVFAGGMVGSIIGVDDVVVEPVPVASPVPIPAPVCESDQIFNGDFTDSASSTSPFHGYGNPASLSNPGEGYDAGTDTALVATNRNNWPRGAYQALNKDCLSGTGGTWHLQFFARLVDASGNGVDCTPSNGDVWCPLARFQKYKNGVYSDDLMYDTEMVWNKDGWSHFSIIFDAPADWVDLASIVLILCGGPAGSDLWIDKVSMTPYASQITVSPQAAACWDVGSDLVITSNTRHSSAYQQASIAATDPITGRITLNDGISEPSTLASDPDHAVEVALLTRRIVFEADSSPVDALAGGHLMILHTPDVAQRLEGVEIRNFGQQGTLGRYPIHFHVCENGVGSVVKKNVM